MLSYNHRAMISLHRFQHILCTKLFFLFKNLLFLIIICTSFDFHFCIRFRAPFHFVSNERSFRSCVKPQFFFFSKTSFYDEETENTRRGRFIYDTFFFFFSPTHLPSTPQLFFSLTFFIFFTFPKTKKIQNYTESVRVTDKKKIDVVKEV